MYPEAQAVLAGVHSRGGLIGIVSDFSFDLRPAVAEHGLADDVDAIVISSDHGFQKPDTRMFTVALDLLQVDAGDTLMVGDRASHDGAAASVGIDTLILPMPNEISHRGLGALLRLIG